VAAAVSTPLNGMLPTIPVSTAAGEVAPSVWCDHVSPEYFHLLEIPILRGRNFTADEARSRAEVAIVSESTARRLWPNRSAVGQEIRIQHDTNTGWGEQVPQHQAVRVIGVARDAVTCCIPWGKDPTLTFFPSHPPPLGTFC
jgi:hypothetical protein